MRNEIVKCPFCNVLVRADIFAPASANVEFNKRNESLRLTCEQCGRVHTESAERIRAMGPHYKWSGKWMPVSNADAKLLAEQEMLIMEWI